MVLETEVVKETIDAPFDAVVNLLADPSKAHEVGTEFFAGPLEPVGEDDEWLATVPLMGGSVRYRQDVDRARGVIDLYLAPEGGDFGPPLPVRVVRNASGVDVLWVLSRFPGVSDEQWSAGIASLRRELSQLKRRVEAGELA